MDNKKDKIVVIGLLVLLLVGIGIYFLLTSNILGNKGVVNTGTTSNATSQINEIDWGTYDSNDITLTKSIEITKDGTYTLTGTISDGLIYINTDGNVKLILNGVSITNSKGPAIYVENAKTLEIETVKGTTNTLTDGSTYSGYDTSIVGTIYSSDDLILSGEGTLKVISNNEDAIVSKDDLKITSGSYKIDATDDGIRCKDSVEITGGSFTINAKGDGIKATNDTDSSKGFILISGGTFNINSVNDGLQAETELKITNGTFNIKTTGNPDNDSAKGLKGGTLIEITGGTFNINSTDDSVHSNGDVTINNGEFVIESDDDGIHGDGLVEINGGTFNINAQEGIEGTYIKINDGTINIKATDDGINAANKSDKYSVSVEINGGSITIVMGQGDTDGIDSNGNLYIKGGTINITGQSAFDYDGEAKYTGGNLIVNGEKTTSITNQFGGQRGGQAGGPNGGDKPAQRQNGYYNRGARR